MSSGKRIKFQGTRLSVESGVEAGKVITAITNANPAVVSVASHGYSNGDVIKHTHIDGMTELEGIKAIIDNIAAGTYELPDIDASEYGVFVPGSPADARAAKLTFSTMCELTGINKQGGQTPQIDVSTSCSTVQEFVSGLKAAGTLQLDFNYAPATSPQLALEAAETNGDTIWLKLVPPGDNGFLMFQGNVQQSSFNGAVGNIYRASCTLQLTGPIYHITD